MKKRILITSVLVLALFSIILSVIILSPDDTNTAITDVTKVSDTENVKNKEIIEETIEPVEPEPEPEPLPSVQIVMVGDMLMHGRVMESGLKDDGTYNFDHLFKNVKSRQSLHLLKNHLIHKES